MSKYVTRKVFAGSGVLAAVWAGALGMAVAQPTAGGPKAAKAAKAAKPAKVDVVAASAALVGTDAKAAAQAATDLGTSDTTAAHEALLNGLAGGLAAGVAEPALAAVAMHPGPADVATLAVYAGHRDADIRIAALTALSAYPAPGARALLVAGLGDAVEPVRAAAIDALVRAKSKAGIDRMIALLGKNEDAAIAGVAALADVDLARKLADQIGKLADAPLAVCLGKILLRADFTTSDDARLQIVTALGKIPASEALAALGDYIEATPPKPPRPSRKEAEAVLSARMGGG